MRRSMLGMVSEVFTPLSIPGSLTWLDGSDGSSMFLFGGEVTSWTDKAPMPANYGASVGIRPVSDGISKLTFDGINDIIRATTGISKFNSLVDYSFSMVFSSQNVATTQILYGVNWVSYPYGPNLYISAGNLFVAVRGDDNSLALISAPISNNVVYLVTATFNGTTLSMYLNGTLISTNTSTGYTGRNCVNITFGRRSNAASNFFNGSLYEFVKYNHVYTSDERTQIETYLNTKHTVY